MKKVLPRQTIMEQTQAAIRLRPFTKKEISNINEVTQMFEVKNDSILYDALTGQNVSQGIKGVYGETCTTEDIYDGMDIEEKIWKSIEKGINFTLFTYGHTGAGKTFTMFGNREKSPGILPLSLESIFAYFYQKVENEFLVKISYLEIYNEQINDLLQPSVSRTAGSYIDKVTEEVCTNIDQILSLIRMGDINRQIGVNKAQERASKASIIFKASIESFTYSEQLSTQMVPISTITLVDLPGCEILLQEQKSERQSMTQQKETSYQFKSIQMLEQVVNSLANGLGNDWIPYRESKLTRYLMDQLEGDSQILWILNISPGDTMYQVNKKAIQFGAQSIKIKQQINSNCIPLEESTLFQVKKKIATLKIQLSNLDLRISKKEQFLQNSTKGSISPMSQNSRSTNKLKSGSTTMSQSLNMSIDNELEEKMRIQNEIKKLQNQILVSDKVSPFMKKYDARRTAAKIRKSVITSIPTLGINNLTTDFYVPEKELPSLEKKRSSLYDRLSKKIENARDYIRTSEIQQKTNELNPFTCEQEEEEYKNIENLRLSRKSQSRRTIKQIQQNLEMEELKQEESGGFLVGRTSLFDQIIDQYPSDQQLLQDSQQDFKDFEPSPQEQIFTSRIDSFKQAISDADNLPKDDESLTEEDLASSDKGNNDHHSLNEDILYDIQEEEDEEDSFEKEKRTKRELTQIEFEKKIDIIERGLTQNIFAEIPLREEGSRSVTEVSNKSQKIKQNLTPDEEASFFRLEKLVSLRAINQKDDDLLTSIFDTAGLDLTDLPPTQLILGQEQKSLRQSLLSKAKRNAKDSLRESFAEADRIFLESIILNKDQHISQLQDQLKERDRQNQQLMIEKAELLKQIDIMKEQISKQ